jgi:hypothetical protein
VGVSLERGQLVAQHLGLTVEVAHQWLNVLGHLLPSLPRLRD